MDASGLSRAAVAVRCSAGSHALGRTPHRQRSRAAIGLRFPLSAKRWRVDLAPWGCAAQRRNDEVYFALEEEDPETEANELKGKSGPTGIGVSELTTGDDEEENTVDESQPITKTRHAIVFVAAEAAPYSKTGGLGDVCGSLPVALAGRGHRVMVVSPRYLSGASNVNIARASDAGCKIKIPCFGGEHEVAFFHEYRAGVDWVFVDHPSYHRAGNPYGNMFGAYGDNQVYTALLCSM